MATNRKKHRAPVPVFQRDPGPWSRLLIDWLATLAVIMIFGLVMLFSASYTTGSLRMGDSFHYIKQQALCHPDYGTPERLPPLDPFCRPYAAILGGGKV